MNENNNSQEELNQLANMSLNELKEEGALKNADGTSPVNGENNPSIIDNSSSQNTSVGVINSSLESSNSMNQNDVASTSSELNQSQVVNSNTVLGSDNLSPKKKKSVIPIVIIGVLVVLVLGFAGYQFLFIRNSKRVITSTVSNVFDMASKTLAEAEQNSIDFNLKNDVLKSKGTIKLDTNIEGIKELSNVLFSYAADVNLKDEKFYISLGAEENNKDIVNAKMYLNANRITIDSNIFPKPYYVDLEEELDFSSIKKVIDELPVMKIQDYRALIEKIKGAVVNSMDEKKMSSQSEKIMIRGKEESVLTHTYSIDYAEASNLMKAILETLGEDDSLEILASALKKDKNTLKKSFDSLAQEIADSEGSSEVILTVKVYADEFLGNFRGFSISSGSSEFTYVTNGTNGNFKVKAVNQQTILKETTIEGTVDYDSSKKSYLIHFTNEGIDFDITVASKSVMEMFVEIKMHDATHDMLVSLDMNSSKSGNTMDGNIKVSLSYKDDESDYSGTLTINESASVGGSVEEAPKNASNIDYMTSLEAEEILSKLFDNLSSSSLKGLGEFLEGIISVEEPEVDYDDYDWDLDYDFDDDYSFDFDDDYNVDDNVLGDDSESF